MKNDEGWRMISRSAEHSLRAVLHLARRPEGEPCPASELASSLGVPDRYLARVLNDLAAAGLLVSTRGRFGGFHLARPPEAISLAEVVSPFQPREGTRACLLTDRPCGVGEPCIAHAKWSRVADGVREFFDETTVADLLRAEDSGPDAVARVRRMTVNEATLRYPRSVAVFGRYGIDACCGGSLPVETAAARHGLDAGEVAAEVLGSGR